MNDDLGSFTIWTPKLWTAAVIDNVESIGGAVLDATDIADHMQMDVLSVKLPNYTLEEFARWLSELTSGVGVVQPIEGEGDA